MGTKRKAWLELAACVACVAASLGSTACGSKGHPPGLVDDTMPRPNGSGGAPPNDSGIADDSGASPDGGGNGGDVRFTKCWADVKAQRGEKPDPWFCFVPTGDHPAMNSVARNFLYPYVGFAYPLDMADRELQVHMTYGSLTIRAPEGKTLATGMYSTAKNDGTAISFAWDTGDCSTAAQVGSFELFEFAWDANNMLTTAEIDFEHHCGDSSPVYGRFRLHSSRPP